MNSIDLLFRSSRFNLSKVGDHFVNPCCFGQDLAAWLREKLTDRGLHADAPGQEDLGWYLGLSHGCDKYLIGISGNPNEFSTLENDGEWRIVVDKSRSLSQRLRGAGKISQDNPLLATIEEILRAEADFHDLRREPPR
jgi:hypothetical protein